MYHSWKCRPDKTNITRSWKNSTLDTVCKSFIIIVYLTSDLFDQHTFKTRLVAVLCPAIEVIAKKKKRSSVQTSKKIILSDKMFALDFDFSYRFKERYWRRSICPGPLPSWLMVASCRRCSIAEVRISLLAKQIIYYSRLLPAHPLSKDEGIVVANARANEPDAQSVIEGISVLEWRTRCSSHWNLYIRHTASTASIRCQ